MVSSDSSKKRTNKFVFSTVRPKNEFVRFLEESEDTKNRFEIIWPLLERRCLKVRMQYSFREAFNQIYLALVDRLSLHDLLYQLWQKLCSNCSITPLGLADGMPYFWPPLPVIVYGFLFYYISLLCMYICIVMTLVKVYFS